MKKLVVALCVSGCVGGPAQLEEGTPSPEAEGVEVKSAYLQYAPQPSVYYSSNSPVGIDYGWGGGYQGIPLPSAVYVVLANGQYFKGFGNWDPEDRWDLNNTGWNDRIEYLQIGAGRSVKIYKDVNFVNYMDCWSVAPGQPYKYVAVPHGLVSSIKTKMQTNCNW